MAGIKRRHEESNFAHPLQLRKESNQVARNVASLSTETVNNYNGGDERVHSPNSIVDSHAMFMPTRESKRALSFASKRDEYDSENDPDAEKRVTIWNWREQRKLSGNSAPFKKNLKDYIRKHPDWEEYVGQDKDSITGKKLSPKKMKPPAPQDPDHPWYAMQRMGTVMPSPSAPPPPQNVAPQTSSYGTRSTQSRIQESDSVRFTKAPPPKMEPQVFETVVTNPELSQPMQVKLESPSAVAFRRSLEMAARRQAMAAEVEARKEESDATNKSETEADKTQVDEAAAWKAAVEHVARLRAQEDAAARQIAEEALAKRRSAHAEEQNLVVSSAMARIEAFKNKRRRTIAA